MLKYPYAVAYGFITLVFSYLAFVVTALVSRWVYEALIDWFPSVFRDYSPVFEAAEYNAAMHTVSVIGTILGVFITSLVVTRLDNGRDEFITKKSEGFYRIPQMMPVYYKAYALPDLVASLITTALICALIIPSHLISRNDVSTFANLGRSFRDFHLGVLYDGTNVIGFILSVFAIFYISKLISGIHALKKWRAAWLSFN